MQSEVDHLLQQAAVKLPGSSEAAIKAELFDVLTEFFDQTSSWTETIYIPGLSGIYAYKPLPVRWGGRIVRLGSVLLNTNFSTQAQFDAATPAQQKSGWIGSHAFLPNFETLQLTTAPDTDQLMAVTVIKNVLLSEEGAKDAIPVAPSEIYSQYGRYLLDGVLGNKMGEQGKTYTNLALSKYHRSKFQDGVSSARVSAQQAQTYGAAAWVFPQAFKVGSQRGYLSIGSTTEGRP